MAFEYLKVAYKQEGDRLFTVSGSDRTRGNGFKLEEGRFRLDFRGKFFLMQMVVGLGTSCPERLWRCSRPGWMGPWGA